jgi:hypothetical protein
MFLQNACIYLWVYTASNHRTSHPHYGEKLTAVIWSRSDILRRKEIGSGNGFSLHSVRFFSCNKSSAVKRIGMTFPVLLCTEWTLNMSLTGSLKVGWIRSDAHGTVYSQICSRRLLQHWTHFLGKYKLIKTGSLTIGNSLAFCLIKVEFMFSLLFC